MTVFRTPELDSRPILLARAQPLAGAFALTLLICGSSSCTVFNYGSGGIAGCGTELAGECGLDASMTVSAGGYGGAAGPVSTGGDGGPTELAGAAGQVETNGGGMPHLAQILAINQGFPAGIVLDSTNVYWTAENDGTVMSVPLGGGSVVTIANQGQPTALAVDGTNVYWIDKLTAAVLKAPKTGAGPVVTVATGKDPYSLAVDASGVYWSDDAMSTVMKAPLAGGSSVTLATTMRPFSVAANGGYLYWFAEGAGALMKVPAGGGTPQNLGGVSGTGAFNFQGIAVDATNVYWTNLFSVVKVPIVGGASVTLSASEGGYAIAVNGSNVFWTEASRVVKQSSSGGAVITVADGLARPNAIAVDATNVYWTDTKDGTISKVSQ